jgi:hypothetical protein
VKLDEAGAALQQLGITVAGGVVQAWAATGGAALAVVIEALDAEFATGRVGLEGIRGGTFGETNFSVGEAPATFPTTTVLDKLNRSENPLSNGGKWAKLFGATTAGEDQGVHWHSVTGFSEGFDAAYWTPEEFTEPGISAIPEYPNNEERWQALFACISNPTTGAMTGYRMRCVEEGGAGLKSTFLIEKCTAGVWAVIAERKHVAVSNEPADVIGLTVASGVVRAWRKASGEAWAVVVEVADASYTKGFVGIGGAGTGPALKEFAEGATGAPKHEHTLSAAQPQAAVMARSLARTMKATQAQAPTLTRQQLHMHLSITQPQVATVSHGAELTQLLSTTQSQTPSMKRSLSRHLTASQTQSVVMNEVTSGGTESSLLSMVI